MNEIIDQFEKDIKEKTGIDTSNLPDIEKLKKDIIAFAETGGDFGCRCYYCEVTPIDLVNRGDAIPVIYIMGGKEICFRCTDGGYYGDVDHVKKNKKKVELLKAYSHEPKRRKIQIKKLKELIKKEN